ncbi:histone-lysine N-methyltransferase SETMAR [Trichonephila inaurata madagascariensis]|uniref:Histone-lysine N-methyltransferase SETMAR n=1 Tax=Trichonephila inaurata madagascariensis TaxID=2747483 RepID=A0A8X7CHH8_9ARAC|nr:histone-lysine N-methyltransferase SETMAR [Trichonephila inaurata madagascariensis]
MAQRLELSLEHLVRYHEDGNDLLFRIVTRDELWVHHFTPEAKVSRMEWKNQPSPVRKQFKTTPSAYKVLLTVFWDAQGVLLLDFLEGPPPSHIPISQLARQQTRDKASPEKKADG